VHTPLPPTQIVPVIDHLIPYVKRREIAGAVILVAQRGEIREFAAHGYADLETQRPMQQNDVFWVASMTKPIVAAAILTLVDDGKLAIDDPVEKYLPEFKERWTVAEKSDDRIVLERSHPLTLRHLLAHTDGLAPLDLPHWETPLAEWVASIARQPLSFQPNTRWAYNNSGLNTLGRIVEVVAEQSLPAFLQDRFFTPLGMEDTTFILSPEQYRRLATTYRFSTEDQSLTPVPLGMFKGSLTSPRLTIFPGGGLFSTAMDMYRFYQMLLNRGVSDGKRYLSEASYTEMTTCQTGEFETGFIDGMCFGLGVGLVANPTGLSAMLSPGTFGHGGAYGTQAWVDPIRQSVSILMCQRSNFVPNPDASEMRQVFNIAVAGLVEFNV